MQVARSFAGAASAHLDSSAAPLEVDREERRIRASVCWSCLHVLEARIVPGSDEREARGNPRTRGIERLRPAGDIHA
mgnify:CR=1 FL=1